MDTSSTVSQIHSLIRQGSISKLTQFLEQNKNPNNAGLNMLHQGQAALHVAVSHSGGREDMVALLLEVCFCLTRSAPLHFSMSVSTGEGAGSHRMTTPIGLEAIA